jgi:uncharacterized protein (UPF0333 family)
MDILFITVIILLIIIIVLLFSKKKEYESFTTQTKNDTSYLYPTKGLQSICAKENLKPSYMPKACYINGTLNSYANCKCEDKYGNCKICYPTIKKDSKNASVVYNAEDF